MYVAIFEIIQREKCNAKISGLMLLLAIVVGFTFMLIIEIYGKYNQWSISFLTRRLQISTSKRDLNSLATIFSVVENLFLNVIDNP